MVKWGEEKECKLVIKSNKNKKTWSEGIKMSKNRGNEADKW